MYRKQNKNSSMHSTPIIAKPPLQPSNSSNKESSTKYPPQPSKQPMPNNPSGRGQNKGAQNTGNVSGNMSKTQNTSTCSGDMETSSEILSSLSVDSVEIMSTIVPEPLPTTQDGSVSSADVSIMGYQDNCASYLGKSDSGSTSSSYSYNDGIAMQQNPRNSIIQKVNISQRKEINSDRFNIQQDPRNISRQDVGNISPQGITNKSKQQRGNMCQQDPRIISQQRGTQQDPRNISQHEVHSDVYISQQDHKYASQQKGNNTQQRGNYSDQYNHQQDPMNNSQEIRIYSDPYHSQSNPKNISRQKDTISQQSGIYKDPYHSQTDFRNASQQKGNIYQQKGNYSDPHSLQQDPRNISQQKGNNSDVPSLQQDPRSISQQKGYIYQQKDIHSDPSNFQQDYNTSQQKGIYDEPRNYQQDPRKMSGEKRKGNNAFVTQQDLWIEQKKKTNNLPQQNHTREHYQQIDLNEKRHPPSQANTSKAKVIYKNDSYEVSRDLRDKVSSQHIEIPRDNERHQAKPHNSPERAKYIYEPSYSPKKEPLSIKTPRSQVKPYRNAGIESQTSRREIEINKTPKLREDYQRQSTKPFSYLTDLVSSVFKPFLPGDEDTEIDSSSSTNPDKPMILRQAPLTCTRKRRRHSSSQDSKSSTETINPTFIFIKHAKVYVSNQQAQQSSINEKHRDELNLSEQQIKPNRHQGKSFCPTGEMNSYPRKHRCPNSSSSESGAKKVCRPWVLQDWVDKPDSNSSGEETDQDEMAYHLYSCARNICQSKPHGCSPLPNKRKK